MQPILDETKRREVCAILSVGGTRAMAARYVGCSQRTLRRAAQRDLRFRQQLRKTEISPEITFLKTMLNAGSDVKHWQAAKWALQHIYPDRYARRPQTLTIEQTKDLISQVIKSIGKKVPDPKTRAAIHRQIAKITRRSTRKKTRAR
jgi:transposase-like protein